jgi:hypothetical protein
MDVNDLDRTSVCCVGDTVLQFPRSLAHTRIVVDSILFDDLAKPIVWVLLEELGARLPAGRAADTLVPIYGHPECVAHLCLFLPPISITLTRFLA